MINLSEINYFAEKAKKSVRESLRFLSRLFILFAENGNLDHFPFFQIIA